MTAHQLAAALLAGPDLPVVINGWGSDEGFVYEVTDASTGEQHVYRGAADNADTPRDHLGWELPRRAISLGYNSNA